MQHQCSISRFSLSLLTLFSAFLLVSCFETKQEFTINPDGSGKLELVSITPNISLNGKAEMNDAELKAAVGRLLEELIGFEAWKDVQYRWTDDGRVYFKGTGYFKDFNKIKARNENGALLSFKWKRSGSRATLQATLVQEDDQPNDAKKIETDPEKRKQEIKKERAQFEQAKPMMSGVFAKARHQAVFHLPGKVLQANGFSKRGSKVAIGVEGKRMFETMEAMINDDEYMMSNSMNMQSGPQNSDEFLQKVFNTKNAVRVTQQVTDKPLFNYQEELESAKKEYAKVLKVLGQTLAEPASAGALKSIKVVGVSISKKLDSSLGLYSSLGNGEFELHLLANFDGSILSVNDKSRVLTAVSESGEDLMLSSRFKQRINGRNLSKNKQFALLEISLDSTKGAKRLAKLTGEVEYSVSSGTKEIDLGFAEFASGQKGGELDAEIKEVKDSWRKGWKTIDLLIDTTPKELEELILVHGDSRTTLRRGGYSGNNGRYTFSFDSEHGFPKGGKLIAVVQDGLKKFVVPIELKGIPLPTLPK